MIKRIQKIKITKNHTIKMEKEKKLRYIKRKPDLNTESLKAWISRKDEVEELEKIAKDEKHKIEIICKNGFKMRLMGFTKMMDKKTNKIVFAYKFKKENRTIIYYVPDYVMKKQKEKIQIFMNNLLAVANKIGYELIDGRVFAERSSEEAKRLGKLRKD